MRKPAVQVRNDMKDEVAQRLAAGESLRSIARSIGCCYQTLQYWREKWGLPKLKPTKFYGEEHPIWKGGVSIDKQG
jgi:predicted transcriptional regulator